MKKTAIAPANIAFIKYWGKAESKTRIPQNNSISMNLSAAFTTTTVEFLPNLKSDQISFINEKATEKELQRIVGALDKIRQRAGKKIFAKVVTQNSFPKSTGIASSASGFASLALAGLTALGIFLNEKDLSIFCRTLSGTACRSIPDGFVEWLKNDNKGNSFAYSLYPQNYWKIVDVLAIVTQKAKKLGSTQGHELSDTSPFYKIRLKNMEQKIKLIKIALKDKNFSQFGKIIEAESLNMHAVCLTSNPALIYWEPETIAVIKQIIKWREENIVESYFTIDAGANVHIICEEKNANKLTNLLKDLSFIKQVILNYPNQGARLVNKHLF